MTEYLPTILVLLLTPAIVAVSLGIANGDAKRNAALLARVEAHPGELVRVELVDSVPTRVLVKFRGEDSQALDTVTGVAAVRLFDRLRELAPGAELVGPNLGYAYTTNTRAATRKELVQRMGRHPDKVEWLSLDTSGAGMLTVKFQDEEPRIFEDAAGPEATALFDQLSRHRQWPAPAHKGA